MQSLEWQHQHHPELADAASSGLYSRVTLAVSDLLLLSDVCTSVRSVCINAYKSFTFSTLRKENKPLIVTLPLAKVEQVF